MKRSIRKRLGKCRVRYHVITNGVALDSWKVKRLHYLGSECDREGANMGESPTDEWV